MNIRFLIPIGLSILVGFLFGKLIFNNYTADLTTVFNKTDNAYFVQYGAYVSIDKMKSSTSNLEKYIYEYDNEYYRVYIGITKDKENIEKIKDYYQDTAKDIYVREMTINSNYAKYLTNSDELLKVATNKDTIGKIIVEGLEKYEEISSE